MLSVQFPKNIIVTGVNGPAKIEATAKIVKACSSNMRTVLYVESAMAAISDVKSTTAAVNGKRREHCRCFTGWGSGVNEIITC